MRRAITLFFLSCLCASCQGVSSVSVTPNWNLSTNTFCPRSWIGTTALNPGDSAITHATQATIRGLYTRFTFDYGGTSNNWAFNDTLVTNNAAYKIIAAIQNTNDPSVYSNAVKQIFTRYTNLWGWLAYGEPDFSAASATNYAGYVKLARYLIGPKGSTPRLCGPSTANDFLDGFLNFLPIVALTNLDVIDAHDYFATPGNGSFTNVTCFPSGVCTGATYAHPTDSPGAGIPPLDGRISNMWFWATQAGASSNVIIDEYGLYSGDANDARLMAGIVARNQPCVILLSTPQGPVGQQPNNNGIPDINGNIIGFWTPVTELMRTACFLVPL